MSRFLWICLGGAAGTGARYLLSGWLLRVAGPGFPWGTLAANVIGSFLLAVIVEASLATNLVPPALRLALTTGLMGGFTTYSTFNYETLQYLQQSDWLPAAANVAATVAGCLLAGTLGVFTGRLLAGS
ncbi:MAG: fluoride efflux transporter CrcB [Thermoanaerobaculia bacterium]